MSSDRLWFNTIGRNAEEDLSRNRSYKSKLQFWTFELAEKKQQADLWRPRATWSITYNASIDLSGIVNSTHIHLIFLVLDSLALVIAVHWKIWPKFKLSVAIAGHFRLITKQETWVRTDIVVCRVVWIKASERIVFEFCWFLASILTAAPRPLPGFQQLLWSKINPIQRFSSILLLAGFNNSMTNWCIVTFSIYETITFFRCQKGIWWAFIIILSISFFSNSSEIIFTFIH